MYEVEAEASCNETVAVIFGLEAKAIVRTNITANLCTVFVNSSDSERVELNIPSNTGHASLAAAKLH